ncbi:hypothetical protein KEM48_009780 [Puccinia striiformis f. sp. tritici PST-130]|nr:hypothetical protein KEM48_009780 [Puccinia striiformis f. sp. tritici PST-130]
MAEGEENPVQPGGFADREEDLGNLDVGSSSLERRALLKLDLLLRMFHSASESSRCCPCFTF